MTRALMTAALLSLSLGAFAAEPTSSTMSKDASAPAAAPAPAEAVKPASAAKKSKSDCEKEGVKGRKAMKKCMAGK